MQRMHQGSEASALGTMGTKGTNGSKGTVNTEGAKSIEGTKANERQDNLGHWRKH